MKFWLSRNSEVPVRAQIVAQVTLGIASGDLGAGEKLPSTRELARRFDIHQNTASAAYRELAGQNMVEFRKGSGVYVCGPQPGSPDSLDSFVARMFREAELLGYSAAEVRDSVVEHATGNRIEGILIAEPNPALLTILIEEISAATGVETRGASEAEITDGPPDGFLLTALFDEEEKLAELLPDAVDCIYLKANSPASTLAGRAKPSEGEIIGIASGWEDFLTLARLFLIAAKIDPDAIAAFSTSEPDWRDRLNGAALIVCDSHTARSLDGDSRTALFRLIAESSLDELRRLANRSKA